MSSLHELIIIIIISIIISRLLKQCICSPEAKLLQCLQFKYIKKYK